MKNSQNEGLKLLKLYVSYLVENLEVSEPSEDEEQQDESSGAGAVAGYVLPLGMDPKKEKSK